MDRAIEAGVDLAMPVLGLRFHEAPPYRQPGIVDQDVEAAEILDDVIDHRLDRGKIGDVGLISLGLAPLRRDLADERIGFLRRTAEIDGDVGAFFGEAQRDFAADAAGGARHQGDLVFQSEIHVRSFTVWPSPVPLR